MSINQSIYLYTYSDPNGPWCPGNQGQPGQGLSVVTTVWGMTNTTQTAPFSHQTPGYTSTMSSANYPQQPGFNVNSMQKGPYNNPPQNNNLYRRPRYVNVEGFHTHWAGGSKKKCIKTKN